MSHNVQGNYPLDVGRRVKYFGGGWRTDYEMLHHLGQAKSSVGFLFGALPGQDNPEPQGTCFFVDWWEENVADGPYLVTARHVWDELRKGGEGLIRVSNPAGGLSTIPLDLNPNQWMFHADKSVDLAVQRWTRDRWQGQASDLIHWPLTSLDIPGSRHLTAPGQPMGTVAFEGENAVFVGLMLDFPGEKKNLPMLRNGMVGLIPDEPIHGGYGPSDYIVLNAQSYKGNSGAPVFVEWSFTFSLIGVLTYAFYEEAERFKVGGQDHTGYNLGVSLVTPLEKLEEVVNSKGEQQRRSKTKKHTPQGERLSAAPDDQSFSRSNMTAALKKVSRRTKPSPPAGASQQTSE